MPRYAIGFDFGNEAVRVVVVDIRGGNVLAAAEERFADSWLDSAARACRRVLGSSATSHELIGMGVSFATSHIQIGIGDSALAPELAQKLGLPGRLPVAAPAINGHAAVPGAGVASPATMVLNLAGDGRHLMNSRIGATVDRITTGVENAILPGYFGYEIEQPHPNEAAAQSLQLYPDELRALELRRICDAIRAAGVPVRRFVALKPLPEFAETVLQTYADVLDARIKVAASDWPRALGAAILGCLAAGSSVSGYASMSLAIHAMAPQRRDLVYRPDLQARRRYDEVYDEYLRLC